MSIIFATDLAATCGCVICVRDRSGAADEQETIMTDVKDKTTWVLTAKVRQALEAIGSFSDGVLEEVTAEIGLSDDEQCVLYDLMFGTNQSQPQRSPKVGGA